MIDNRLPDANVITLIASAVATDVRAALPTLPGKHCVFDADEMLSPSKLLRLLTKVVLDLTNASEPQKLVTMCPCTSILSPVLHQFLLLVSSCKEQLVIHLNMKSCESLDELRNILSSLPLLSFKIAQPRQLNLRKAENKA